MRSWATALFVALCLGGCTLPPLGIGPRRPAAPQTPVAQDTPRAKINRLLTHGDYDAALEGLLALPTYRDTQRRIWVKTLNGLLTRANTRMDAGQFLAAGRDCRKVFDALPLQPRIYQSLELTRPQILELIDINANRLFLKGMRAYRRGDLQQALEIWNGIDSFHPGHLSSQRAIRTTRKQLQKLNDHPPG